MGFKQCLIPHSTPNKSEFKEDIELVPVRTVQEALEILFH